MRLLTADVELRAAVGSRQQSAQTAIGGLRAEVESSRDVHRVELAFARVVVASDLTSVRSAL